MALHLVNTSDLHVVEMCALYFLVHSCVHESVSPLVSYLFALAKSSSSSSSSFSPAPSLPRVFDCTRSLLHVYLMSSQITLVSHSVSIFLALSLSFSFLPPLSPLLLSRLSFDQWSGQILVNQSVIVTLP